MLPVSRTTHKRRLLQKPFTCRSTYDRQANKNRYFLFRLKICYILYISTNYSEYSAIDGINCCPPPQQILPLIAADDATVMRRIQSLYRMTPNVKKTVAVTICVPVFLIGGKDLLKDERAFQAMMNADR